MGLKGRLIKLITDGVLSCFSCGKTLSYASIQMVDFDSRRIYYECESCGNSSGMRTFKAIGLDFDPNTIDWSTARFPFLIVMNGEPVNASTAEKFLNDVFRGFASGKKTKKVKIISVKPAPQRKSSVDLDALQLDEGFKAAIREDIKTQGSEKKYWRDTVNAAKMEGKTLLVYLKECEKDYLQHHKKKKDVRK